MLRILLQPTERYIHQYFGILEVMAELRDLGIELGMDLENPDLEFSTITVVEKKLEAGSRLKRPTIVYERADAASIYPPYRRQFISHPDVIGWAKGMGLRRADEYNAPLVEGKRHFAMIAPELAEPPEPILGDAELQKIKAIMPVFAWETFRPLIPIQLQKLVKRRVDVGYTGAMSGPDGHVGKHRLICTRKLADFEQLNVLIGVGRCFSPAAMYEMMRDTRIFVSPYGQGEYSSKDYEAILSGAVLVKPSSEHVVTDGFDIFSSKNCVACAPDFSDLHEVVSRLLANPQEMAAFATAARTRLVRTIEDRHARAQRLAEFFLSCASRAPASMSAAAAS